MHEPLLFQIPIRWCSSEPIFKVRKTIVWDELSEQQSRSEPETSSIIQVIIINSLFISLSDNNASFIKLLFLFCGTMTIHFYCAVVIIVGSIISAAKRCK